MNFANAALRIAAKVAGLRPDQVARAVQEYRDATEKLHDEPEWRAVMHMSGPTFGLAQYTAEGTRVAMQIDSWKARDGWTSETTFTLDGRPYETFGEARQVELEAIARPTPHDISAHYAHSARNER